MLPRYTTKKHSFEAILAKENCMNNMSALVPKEVKYIIETLQNAGFESYLVGGCTRDYLMGKTPKDFDVATNATPAQVHEVFLNSEKQDVHLIDTGIKQGTVTVIKNHIPVEVTTYRTEGKYSDSRHPDEISFSRNIKDDLARRDFTMNAIAWNPLEKELLSERGVEEGIEPLIDLFGGISDIEKGIISCVGNPKERFREDALRIMRALRFASVLDFDIEEETRRAIFELKETLNLISKERIQKELEGLLCGKAVERVLRDYAEVIAVVIPEIVPMFGLDQCNPYHIYDVWEHTIRVVSGTPETPVLRLAALFHDIGKPPCFTKDENGIGHFYGHPIVSCEIAEKTMRRLKFDNVTREKVLTLVRWHDLRPEPTNKSVRKVLMRVGTELFDDWISIKRADNLAQAPHLTERQEMISEIKEIGHELIESEGELSLKTLNISGRDLIELGYEEGPEIGEILDYLLTEVSEEKIANDRDALMDVAKTKKNR